MVPARPHRGSFALLSWLLCLLPAAISQSEGDLRLIDRSTDSALQVVEIFYDGSWGRVCKTHSGNEAIVICRQLGLNFTEAVSSDKLEYDVDVKVRSVACEGTEDSLVECVIFEPVTTNATSCQDFGYFSMTVTCKGEFIAEGDLRLVQNMGGSETDGLLEIYLHGVWQTMCFPDFTKTEAEIACKQLGLDDQGVVAYDFYKENYYDYDNRGFFSPFQVTCWQSEARLIDCGPVVEDRGCYSHVGLSCGEYTNEGDLRLVGGPRNNLTNGKLQVYKDGQWELFCVLAFGTDEGTVACRQLGLNHTVVRVYHYYHLYGVDYDDYVLPSGYLVYCDGDERRLDECSDIEQAEDCPYFVGLGCGEMPDPETATPDPYPPPANTTPIIFIIVVVSVIGTVVILIICCCYCCFCRRRGSPPVSQQYTTVTQTCATPGGEQQAMVAITAPSAPPLEQPYPTAATTYPTAATTYPPGHPGGGPGAYPQPYPPSASPPGVIYPPPGSDEKAGLMYGKTAGDSSPPPSYEDAIKHS